MIRSLGRQYVSAFEGLPRSVWLISFVLLVNRSGTMVLPFWALYCTSERGLSVSQAGELLAIYGLGGVAGSLLGGWLTTRVGSIRVQWLSLILTAVGFTMLGSMRTRLTMAIAIAFLSIVAEAIRPAVATATADFSPDGMRPRAMALNRLAINLGMTIGPALGGFLAFYSFELLFLCDAITCAVAAVVIFVFFRRGRNVHHHKEVESDSSNGRRPWLDREFLLFLGIIFLSAIVFFQLIGTYMVYLRDAYGLDEWQIGLVLATNTIIIVLVEMVLVHRLENHNRLRVVAWGCLFVGLAFGVLPFGSGMAWAIFSMMIWTVGEMLSAPMSAAYVSLRADPRQRGNYLGIYTMTFSAASVVAPILGTRLYEVNPNLVWFGGLAVSVGCFLSMIALSYRGARASVQGCRNHVSVSDDT